MLPKERKAYEKKALTALNFAVSKDETRPYLMGVQHREQMGALVSSNGHVATVLYSMYCPQLAGKIMHPKTYGIIDREFPKLEAVVPTELKHHVKVSVLIEKHHYAKGKPRNPQKIFLNVDNEGRAHFSFERNENTKIAINAEYLKPVADGNYYEVYYSNSMKPIRIDLSEATSDFYVIMPLKMDK